MMPNVVSWVFNHALMVNPLPPSVYVSLMVCVAGILSAATRCFAPIRLRFVRPVVMVWTSMCHPGVLSHDVYRAMKRRVATMYAVIFRRSSCVPTARHQKSHVAEPPGGAVNGWLVPAMTSCVPNLTSTVQHCVRVVRALRFRQAVRPLFNALIVRQPHAA